MKKKSIKKLFKAYKKVDTVKNRILILTVSFTVLILSVIFSLAIGKVNADKLRIIRYDGKTLSTYLENGTEKELEQLNNLNYIEQIGREKIVGSLLDEHEEFCKCAVVDKITYEEIISPAYTDIIGSYPEKENEIMMSLDALKYMGIHDPEIGMEIEVQFSWKDGKLSRGNGMHQFVLSGWFEDYIDTKCSKMQAYLSKKFLDANKITLFPTRVWIGVKKDYWEGQEIEKKLYVDVELSNENQYFVGIDSAEYRSLENVFGGYGTAGGMSFVILLGMFLLTYNIFSLSISKDIKQYGLLEVVGITVKEIQNMLRYQAVNIWLMGSVIGGGLSLGFFYVIYPKLLQKMYLDNMQNLENVKLFYPEILVVTFLLVGGIFIWSSGLAGREISKRNPIDALRYEEVDDCSVEMFKMNVKNTLWKLAIRNVLRSKKKFLLTTCSLILGCVIGICAVAITEGNDNIHKLEESRDFNIEFSKEICTNEIYYYDNELIRIKPFFSGEQMKYIENISLSNEIVKGYLPIYGRETGEIFDVFNLSKLERIVVVEIINEKEVEQIKKYITEQKLDVDFEEFQTGNGFIVAHQHLLTESEVNSQLDKRIELYKAVKEGSMINQNSYMNFSNCGYLDLTEENIPQLNLVWEEREVIHLLGSEKAEKKLSQMMPKQILSIGFDVNQEQEPALKRMLNLWTTEQNIAFQTESGSEKELLSITAKSDVIAKEENYLQGSRIVMGMISIAIIFVGLLNYFNTFTVGIVSRKRELAVMESIGLTRKQLQKILVMEGLYYWIVVSLGIITLGSAVIIGVEKIISTQTAFFYFNYPIVEVVTIISILFVICMIVPKQIYKSVVKESVIERLRKSVL